MHINAFLSPQVAFRSNNLEFVSHELCIRYSDETWAGRHFLSLSDNADERSLSYRNPFFVLRQVTTHRFGHR